MPDFLRMTIVVGAYNMAREIPRTLYTLTRDYQRRIGGLQYDVVIVDNGSAEPLDEAALLTIMPEVQVRRIATPSPSPAAAINAAVRESDAPYVGLMIDGARMMSPGLLGHAANALRIDPDGVVGTYGLLLGHGLQKDTMTEGYNQQVEDRLLETVPWRENGYRLFDISVFGGSSMSGWYTMPVESNACFLSRAFWDELDGLDERFRSPGGGAVNIDFWQSAIEARKQPPWMLIGEGTFHQFHGGASTNEPDNAVRRAMFDEYEEIRSEPFPESLRKPLPRLMGKAPQPHWGKAPANKQG